ncbi:hypothetical protein AAD018_010875 [Aestuariibius insulae]|uniref:hypothetical protein n=1 Tax=Aestuariibius insulae TaxID=2058287 RepID=UPI00345EDC92
MSRTGQTPDPGDEFDGQLTESRVLFKALSDDLAAALRSLDGDCASGARAVKQRRAALVAALEHAKAVEAWIDDERDKTGRGGKASPLDLDAVRHQIGCRLHRLRSCCKAG